MTGVCAGVVLVLGGAGCGSDEPAAPGSSPPPTSASSAEGESTPTTQRDEPTPTELPSTRGSYRTEPPEPSRGPDSKHDTITGTIAKAVEANCLVLDTSDGQFLLLGAPKKVASLEPGTELVVRGGVAESVATTCQQGTPFKVSTAHPK